MSRSVNEILATPSGSKRKLDATYVKSCRRSTIPKYAPANVKKAIKKISYQLKEIGLTQSTRNMWSTYKVNALYDFSYKKLLRYESILKSQIEKDISEMDVEVQDRFQHIIVKIQHFPEIICTERDNPPVKITISCENEEGTVVNHFTGFLLSIERKAGFMEEERVTIEAVILPLFLVDFTDDFFLESVKNFLQDNFSCFIGLLKFSSYDLIFMLFLFCSPSLDNSANSTSIEYKGPSENLNHIEYMIDHHTISMIWQQMALQFAGEVSEAEVFEFLSILEFHFYKMFHINLSCLDLQVIKTPLAIANANSSSVMLVENNKLYYVLRHLTHLAQELFLSK